MTQPCKEQENLAAKVNDFVKKFSTLHSSLKRKVFKLKQAIQSRSFLPRTRLGPLHTQSWQHKCRSKNSEVIAAACMMWQHRRQWWHVQASIFMQYQVEAKLSMQKPHFLDQKFYFILLQHNDLSTTNCW